MTCFKRQNIYIIIAIIVTFLAMIGNINTNFICYASNISFDPLKKKLIEDGFDKTRITDLYDSSTTYFNANSVAKYFVHNESKLNYEQFTNQTSIENAKTYMNVHNTDLTNAEKNYGVDKEVITAILLVETRLGRYTGDCKVFNTLSTMAALIWQNTRIAVWKHIPLDNRISRENFESKADSKSAWAYKELKAFLNYTKQQNINPLHVTGSYAGAIGIAQFIPSSLVLLGRDGNKNGKVDLFEHSDAIFSTANYLSHYGWYPGINQKEALKTVRHYNNSSYYANTIIKITDLLKG